MAALIVSPNCSSAAGTSTAMWTVGQREELAERTEWTWYLAGCLSWTTTQSAGKTEQNRFPGNLGIGWVSGKCILLGLDLTHSVLPPPASSSQAHGGNSPRVCLPGSQGQPQSTPPRPAEAACSFPSFASPSYLLHPPSDPSSVGLGFWQSSNLDILEGHFFFMIFLVFFFICLFVSYLYLCGIFFQCR